ncbi:MAG TPA: hypothetical protein VGG04_07615 [Candidatus Sulfotelmatobacter sp.]|jgi:hypothetical protein
MPKVKKIEAEDPAWDSETRLLAWLATCVSIFSFLFYFRNGDVLLYGDAVAHINIARRVFDSQTPGLLQLGTVWLPLPHLLMIPFLISRHMWQSGAGGSIPSMAGYVFGVIGIFRLTRNTLSRQTEPDRVVRAVAWVAAITYAANPNLIYMQATAMGESLYLAFFIWAIVYFGEWLGGGAKSLTRCGFCLAAACLTRYDGWFLAAAMAGAAVILYVVKSESRQRRSAQGLKPEYLRGATGASKTRDLREVSYKSSFRESSSRASLVKFVLIAAAAPALWLAYNGLVYRNPLEFANGPYSARAIERKTQSAGDIGHPGSGNPLLAGLYFVKSGEANVAQNEWLQRCWILLLVGGMVSMYWLCRGYVESRAALTFAFLLLPVPFYALSVAYGGVPIFVPYWWPFSHYNVRYGLQLLPAFAMAPALLVYLAMRAESANARLRLAFGVGIGLVVAASYVSVWRATPVCLEEARVNMRTRTQFERELAVMLGTLPDRSTILMYLGDHVGALERAGIPLKRTINEGNHRVWKQPSDPDGLWERALANPSQYADYVVAFEGDPVWKAVQGKNLRELIELHVSGQARAALYKSR